ncbi:MAG: four helix bundle protein [Fuerstiella sp.]
MEFAVRALNVAESLPDTRTGKHVGGQLLRSGPSPAPNYGEAQSAESRKDFIHRLNVALKELREKMIWLKIIERKPLCKPNRMKDIIEECDELIAILTASIRTAQENQ